MASINENILYFLEETLILKFLGYFTNEIIIKLNYSDELFAKCYFDNKKLFDESIGIYERFYKKKILCKKHRILSRNIIMNCSTCMSILDLIIITVFINNDMDYKKIKYF